MIIKVEKYLINLRIHAATARGVMFPSSDSKEYTLHELMQSYADQEVKQALNKAFFGKDRIKGIPSTNKIQEFINSNYGQTRI
tara:strand:+ start:4677 stop:4925 length:249 start_codon:yes stop_codon:yes gene_type:complete